MTILSVIWYALIFVLIAGYFVLDGFDLGAGVLSPFVAKNDEEKAIVRQAIGPVWDGNEVWLLTAGGALFAAFAPAYATTFSGFYLAIILVLVGLIMRAVSIEWAGHDASWRKIWNAFFFVGSLLPALLTGVAVGNIYQGIPMSDGSECTNVFGAVNPGTVGDYIGVPLLGLVTPFTLLTGLLCLSIFILMGAAWLSIKAPEGSDLLTRVRSIRKTMAIIAVVLCVAVSAYALLIIGVPGDLPIFIPAVFAILFVVAIVLVIMRGTTDKDISTFIIAALSAVALVGLLGTSMFPHLVVAGLGDPIGLNQVFGVENLGTNIGVADASEDGTLAWMLGITVVALPLVLFYHFLVYRAFMGRISPESLEY